MDNKLTNELVKTVLSKNKLEIKISQAIAVFQDEITSLREKETELNEAIRINMEKAGLPKFENDVLRITYIAPTIRNAIDVAKLKEEQPELASKYMKQSKVKSGIRIKIKETI